MSATATGSFSGQRLSTTREQMARAAFKGQPAIQVKESGGSGFISKPYRIAEMEQLLASLF